MLHIECKYSIKYEFSLYRKFGYRNVQGSTGKRRVIIEAENVDNPGYRPSSIILTTAKISLKREYLIDFAKTGEILSQRAPCEHHDRSYCLLVVVT